MDAKNYKNLFSLILIGAFILSPFALQNNAFAQTGMWISAEADAGSTEIVLNGHTASRSTDLTVVVNSPNGNLVSVDQISPDANGDFMTVLHTDGILWNQNGNYLITVQQGEASIYKLSVSVVVSNGVAMATSDSSSTFVDRLPLVGIRNLEEDNRFTLVADIVLGSTEIPISGSTDRVNSDVTIIVTSPNGNIVRESANGLL